MIAGSNVAANPSGVGKEVAPIVVNPVKHSSCTTAGIPKRVSLVSLVWAFTTFLMPSFTVVGKVPKTRVS